MAETTKIKTRIQLKNDTETNWSKATNFIPKKGELIIYNPTSGSTGYKFKIGQNDITKINDLSFAVFDATCLPASGVTAGSYGQTSAGTLTYGGTFKIPYITVDSKGRITSARTMDMIMPENSSATYTAGNGLSLSGTQFSVSYSTTVSALGTASVGTSTAVARGDHTHALPALTSCTGTLSVAKGGTGATTEAEALTNLGAVNKTGDTMTGDLTAPTFIGTLSGNATSSNKLTTNAGDVNTPVYFESGVPKVITSLSASLITTGILPVANGGTGASSKSAARINLGISSGTSLPSSADAGDIFFLYS